MLRQIGLALAVLMLALPSFAQEAPVAADGSYRLGEGDKVRVIVFGEEDLSGEFVVDDAGQISLPLVGQVPAANTTTRELELAVANKLKEGYLRDPRVSVEVLNFRPIYIHGEVNKPDKYPYVNGMTVMNAIAMAGGYTYRADTDDVYITRGNSPVEQKVDVTPMTRVEPGDVIRVPERFF